MRSALAQQSPGVYFENVDTGAPGLAGVRTDIAGFVGICERGALDTPVEIGSWEQFRFVFGELLPTGCLAYAVRGFFENGGALCHVVRVAARPAATAADPTAPRDRAGSSVLSVQGFAPGAAVTVRQADHALEQLVSAVDPQLKRLVWDGGLDESFDLSATAPALSFETGPAAGACVLRDERGVPTLRVEAASPGAWGNRLSVSPGRSTRPGTFSLGVRLGGRLAAVLTNLSFDPAEPGYVEQAPGAAGLVRLVDLQSSTPPPASVPDPRRGARLRGGRDGIAALTLRDLLGEPGSARSRGLRALEAVDAVALVCMPDLVLPAREPVVLAPEPPPAVDPCLPSDPVPEVADPSPAIQERWPGFSSAQIAAGQRAMLAHCEEQRDRFALLDLPRLGPRLDDVDTGLVTAWRDDLDSSFGALFAPWLMVPDPLRVERQPVRPLPPSGHVAGIYARTDLLRGVHVAPANAPVRWAQAPTADIDPALQGVLNPEGIDCIRTLPGRGLRLYGARTVSSDAQLRFVNVRRLLLMIEESLEKGMAWAVFEPNDLYLRQTLAMSITGFLESLWERGALVGSTAEEAFFVRCDAANNPPPLADVGELLADVGVAPVRPAEFVFVRVGRTESELRVTERGA